MHKNVEQTFQLSHVTTEFGHLNKAELCNYNDLLIHKNTAIMEQLSRVVGKI